MHAIEAVHVCHALGNIERELNFHFPVNAKVGVQVTGQSAELYQLHNEKHGNRLRSAVAIEEHDILMADLLQERDLLFHVGFNFGITHFNKNIIDGLETVEHGVPRTSEKEMVTEYMVQGERGGTG